VPSPKNKNNKKRRGEETTIKRPGWGERKGMKRNDGVQEGPPPGCVVLDEKLGDFVKEGEGVTL